METPPLSDMTMPDAFEWPDQATLKDESAFRMWLIQALSSIHAKASETARLQKITNGRVDTLETAVKPLETITLRISLLERLVFGAAGVLLVSILGAVAALVLVKP